MTAATNRPVQTAVSRHWGWLALLPLAFYLAHPVAYHVLQADPWNALWVCYLSNLVLALGLLLRSPHLVSVALLWLLLGNAMWLLHLALGGVFLPSELAPHLGGLAVAVLAAGRLGWAAGSWYRAFLALAGCLLLSRWLTPQGPNINLSHRVWNGWEAVFPSHLWYLVLLGLAVLSLFLAAELLLRRLWPGTCRATAGRATEGSES